MASATPSNVPSWLEDGITQTLDELRLFVLTAWSITVRPRAFGRDWGEGRIRALNPLGFLATSLAFSGLVEHVIHGWRGVNESTTLVREIIAASYPYVWYLAIGLGLHAASRLSKARVPLRGTLGVTLYAAGGPAMLTRLVAIAVPLVSAAPRNLVSIFVTYVFWRSLAVALDGLNDVHGQPRASRLKALAAMLVGFAGVWLFFRYAPAAWTARLDRALSSTLP